MTECVSAGISVGYSAVPNIKQSYDATTAVSDMQ